MSKSKQFIVGTLLGAVLGFSGQFLGDFVFLPIRHIPVTGMPETQVQYMFSVEDGNHECQGYTFEGWLKSNFDTEKINQARSLMLEYMLLIWLTERGQTAARTAILGSLIWMFVADQIPKIKTARNEARVAQGFLCLPFSDD